MDVTNNDIVPAFDEVPCDGVKLRLSTVDALEHCIVIAPDGYLDAVNADCFLGRVAKIIDTGFRWLVFDLHGLTYASSTSFRLSLILQAMKVAAGDIVFMNVQPNVYEVLQLLGFSQFYPIQQNIEDAVSHFVGRLDGVKMQRTGKCPTCSGKVKLHTPGRFMCRHCRTVFAIDPTGQVSLG